MSIISRKLRARKEKIAREAADILAKSVDQFLKDAGIPEYGYFCCIFEKDRIGTGNILSNVDMDNLIITLRDAANQLEKAVKKSKANSN